MARYFGFLHGQYITGTTGTAEFALEPLFGKTPSPLFHFFDFRLYQLYQLYHLSFPDYVI